MSEPLTFSIKETATQSGLTEDTIRYYEKIGLLPRAKRKQNSHRIYHLDDVETMRMIACFKKTGMSLESMKPYLQLSQGDDLRAYPELFALMEEHKKQLKIKSLPCNRLLIFLRSN